MKEFIQNQANETKEKQNYYLKAVNQKIKRWAETKGDQIFNWDKVKEDTFYKSVKPKNG